MTVQGEIPASQVGITLPHEHLLCDLRALWHPPPGDRPELLAYVDKDPAPEDRGPLCSDPYVCRPNLLLEDPALAARELKYFRDAGGGAVVELTTSGLRPRPADLVGISESAGVHVVVGCGWYRASTSPPGLAELSERELAASLLKMVKEGLPDSGGVRPGAIGEVGTGAPLHPDELKGRRAGVRVQAQAERARAGPRALWGAP